MDHTFGRDENYGDVTFTATPTDEHFNLDLSRNTGRDRDNYDSTTWMEKQSQ